MKHDQRGLERGNGFEACHERVDIETVQRDLRRGERSRTVVGRLGHASSARHHPIEDVLWSRSRIEVAAIECQFKKFELQTGQR